VSTACAYDQKKLNCTQDEAIRAEQESNRLNDWNSVYLSFQRFAHCDDGAISEGYSDSIGRLLSVNWKDFPRLLTLTTDDQKFERFVIKHIDETVPKKVLDIIIENASNKCPTDGTRLCRLIKEAASSSERP
jgi:hypothetical protein